jgi:molybdopterin converting factor small subunit
MSVKVLLFGAARLTVGREHVVVDAGQAPTCRAVLTELGAAYPALRPIAGVGRLAVNSEFASGDQQVRSTDEVALIGLVSGG